MNDKQSHRRYLLDLLQRFASGEMEFSNFYNDFYFYYADELPEDALNNQDTDYFGAIHEKLDFVAPDEPDSESRRYGWISAKEFRNWLEEKLRDVPT